MPQMLGLLEKSINRNIVECKDMLQVVCGCQCRVLIETLWNVKRLNNIVISSFFFVLIETLWNVKHYKLHVTPSCTFVLIETLWNVKDHTTTIIIRDTVY